MLFTLHEKQSLCISENNMLCVALVCEMHFVPRCSLAQKTWAPRINLVNVPEQRLLQILSEARQLYFLYEEMSNFV